MIIETIIVVKHLWWLKKTPHKPISAQSIYVLIDINFLNDGCVLNQPHVFIDELLMRSTLALSLFSLSLSYFSGQKVFVMCGPTVRER